MRCSRGATNRRLRLHICSEGSSTTQLQPAQPLHTERRHVAMSDHCEIATLAARLFVVSKNAKCTFDQRLRIVLQELKYNENEAQQTCMHWRMCGSGATKKTNTNSRHTNVVAAHRFAQHTRRQQRIVIGVGLSESAELTGSGAKQRHQLLSAPRKTLTTTRALMAVLV